MLYLTVSKMHPIKVVFLVIQHIHIYSTLFLYPTKHNVYTLISIAIKWELDIKYQPIPIKLPSYNRTEDKFMQHPYSTMQHIKVSKIFINSAEFSLNCCVASYVKFGGAVMQQLCKLVTEGSEKYVYLSIYVLLYLLPTLSSLVKY